MANTVIECWGGLHDGKRLAIRADRKALPPEIYLVEPAPVSAKATTDPKPTTPGKYRYTYRMERTPDGRVRYRYAGYVLEQP